MRNIKWTYALVIIAALLLSGFLIRLIPALIH